MPSTRDITVVLDFLANELSERHPNDIQVDSLVQRARSLYNARQQLWSGHWQQIGVKTRPVRQEQLPRERLQIDPPRGARLVGAIACAVLALIGLIGLLGISAFLDVLWVVVTVILLAWWGRRTCRRLSPPHRPVEPRPRRCSQCGYDLSGHESPIHPDRVGVDFGPRQCPECGMLWPMRPELTLSPAKF